MQVSLEEQLWGALLRRTASFCAVRTGLAEGLVLSCLLFFLYYAGTGPGKMMMDRAGSSGASPSAESPSASTGVSTSLEGHASSSVYTESTKFDSASSELSSPSSTSTSTPGNRSIESYPQKEGLDFLSDNLRPLWRSEIIRAFNEGLEVVDRRGNIGQIPEK